MDRVCPHCGYDLAGLEATKLCPECGNAAQDAGHRARTWEFFAIVSPTLLTLVALIFVRVLRERIADLPLGLTVGALCGASTLSTFLTARHRHQRARSGMMAEVAMCGYFSAVFNGTIIIAVVLVVVGMRAADV